MVSRAEESSGLAIDRASTAQAEAERARTKAQSVEVRATEREADLKDRVRQLEERLVLLTEPNDALFADQRAEATAESEAAETEQPSRTGLISHEESSAARCITLLVEVSPFRLRRCSRAIPPSSLRRHRPLFQLVHAPTTTKTAHDRNPPNPFRVKINYMHSRWKQ